MRLRLDLGDAWTYVDQPRQRIALAPGSTPTQPSALVAWGPLFPVSGDDQKVLAEVLAVELGKRRLQADPAQPGTTDRGWPFFEQSARVIDGDRLAEERRAALFRFTEWRGVVIARSFDPARWIALEPVVRAALARVTPDWRGDGEVVCVSHLYEPVVE